MAEQLNRGKIGATGLAVKAWTARYQKALEACDRKECWRLLRVDTNRLPAGVDRTVFLNRISSVAWDLSGGTGYAPGDPNGYKDGRDFVWGNRKRKDHNGVMLVGRPVYPLGHPRRCRNGINKAFENGEQLGSYSDESMCCRMLAVPFGRLCKRHGGAAPNQIKKARHRIAMASDTAAATHVEVMVNPLAQHKDRLAAAKEILDRAGVNSKTEVEVTLKPWQQLLTDLVEDKGSASIDNVVDAEVVDDPELAADIEATESETERETAQRLADLADPDYDLSEDSND
jgi:hypothetical protein